MDIHQIELSVSDFNRLSTFIHSCYGIKLPPAKKTMLQARLQSRLKANNINSFKEYCDFVFSLDNKENEIVHMIDVVSTNKTDFFREPAHFDFLKNTYLPEFVRKHPGETLNIWSSACSSGEEAYTTAMIVSEFSESQKKIDFRILGTDISTKVLEKAVRAIYTEDKILPIPFQLKMKYLLRNKNPIINDFRIVGELRNKISFKRLNLMDDYYDVPKTFDLIFCRNVLIYFDRSTQERVIINLCNHLKPGGYFFLGHSETLSGLNTQLKQIKPTIYIKMQ